MNQNHTEDAVAAKTAADQLEQQVAAPMADLKAKLDQVISGFSATQNNIRDMNSRLGRLEQRTVDLANLVQGPAGSSAVAFRPASRGRASPRSERAGVVPGQPSNGGVLRWTISCKGR